jgi:hypothetical protein
MNSDEFFLKEALETQTAGSNLKSKSWVYNQDNLNASQPTQIRFICDGFRSSDKACNLAEAFIVLPLVMCYTSTSNLSSIENLDMLTVMKNHINLIESFSVEIDNTTICQLTPKINLMNNFKLVQEESYDSMYNNGSFRGFYKDENNYKVEMFKYPTLLGQGIVNNNINNNEGLEKRLQNENNFSYKVNKMNDIKNFNVFYPGQNNIEPLKNTFNRLTNNCYYKYLSAYIKLTDLSDFFLKMVPTRGLNMNILLNLSTNSVCKLNLEVQSTGSPAVTSFKSINIGDSVFTTNTITNQSIYTSGISCANNVMPYTILAPSTSTYSVGTITAGQHIITIGCYYSSVRPTGFDQSTIANGISHPIKYARLYAPMIEYLAEMDIAYFSKNSEKTILYDDYLYFIKPAVSSQFNEQLTPSLKNIKTINVIPLLSQIVGGKHEFENPFSCCPNYSSIFDIQEFNVQLASRNIFQEDQHFSVEQFDHEINKNGKVEGNNGLLSLYDFNNLYHYYYVNLERHAPELDNFGKAVQIKGKLNCVMYDPTSLVGNNTGAIAGLAPNNPLPLDLHCFISVQKKVIINCDTGKVVVVL